MEGFVRVIGLEPTCLTASDPKSDTSANFATPARQKSCKTKAFKGKKKGKRLFSPMGFIA